MKLNFRKPILQLLAVTGLLISGAPAKVANAQTNCPVNYVVGLQEEITQSLITLAVDLNDHNQVLVWDYGSAPYILDEESQKTFIPIPSLPSSLDPQSAVLSPSALNNQGLVVGSVTATTYAGRPYSVPFEFNPTTGQSTIISPPLGFLPQGFEFMSQAVDINDVGQILGCNMSIYFGRGKRCWIRENQSYTLIDAQLPSSAKPSLNQSGDVAVAIDEGSGRSTLASWSRSSGLRFVPGTPQYYFPFLINDESGRIYTKTLAPQVITLAASVTQGIKRLPGADPQIPGLANEGFYPIAVNGRTILGAARPSSEIWSSSQPIVYEDGQVYSLWTFLPPELAPVPQVVPRMFLVPTAINANGSIIATWHEANSSRVFIFRLDRVACP